MTLGIKIGEQPTGIAVVGDNTIDRYVDSAIVGGNALNVAAQLTLAGRDVGYYGAVGTDALADVICAGMKRIGLSTHNVVTMSGSTAVTDIAVLPDGERIFEREEFGVTADFFPSAAQLDDIARCSWIHIGTQPRARDLRSAIRARNPRAIISQDMAVSSGLDDLDVAFNSGAMLDGIEPREAIERQLKAGVSVSVVTLGSEGAIGSDGEQFAYIPAKRITVVDATGAGDSFIAGFITAMTQGAALSAALESGTHFAAATCAHRGGWPQ